MNMHVSKLLEVADEIRADWVTMADVDGRCGIADRINYHTNRLQQIIDIMNDALHQTDHFIVFSENAWSIEHLVSCRPNMTDCIYHRTAQEVYGKLGLPHPVGKYKMTLYLDKDKDIPPRIGLDKES